MVYSYNNKVQCLSAVCVNAKRSGDDVESDEFVGQSFMLAERRLKSENNEGESSKKIISTERTGLRIHL